MSAFQVVLLGALVIASVAAVIDYRTGLIPNKLTYPLVMGGALVHVVLGELTSRHPHHGWILLETLSGALICGLIPLLLWRSDAMGGGDVKLLIGLGALLGPPLGLRVELYAFMAAVVAAPLLLVYRGQLIETLKRSFALLLSPFRRAKAGAPAIKAAVELRFGPAICAAMAIVAATEWK